MKPAINKSFDEVFSSQQVFRLLADGMARPGKSVRLPGLSLNTPVNLTAGMGDVILTLLDNETTFAVYPYDQAIEDFICIYTGARSTFLSEAEFVILDGQACLNGAAEFRTGTLQFPERGATLLITAELLNNTADYDRQLVLSGPGINGVKILPAKGIKQEIIRKIQFLNREFPLGVDTILVDRWGEMVCIPRSTHIEEAP